jgi:protoporphyrinogen/coproporphyrinogen III oxidase
VTGRGRAVVVGGGVAGLTWALDALDAGYAVTVLERDEQLGGAVRQEQLGPITVDVGAESFAVTRPELLALCDRLGLGAAVERPATHQAHILTHGRLLPLPPGLLGIPADADDVAELLGAEHAAEARRRDAFPLPPHPPASLGRLVRDRLGDAVADVLVDPVVAGVHATRADDAELASVAPTLYDAARAGGGLMAGVRALRGTLGPAGAPVASLTGGMGGLVEQLVTTLRDRGAQLRTGVTVTAVRRSSVWEVHSTADELQADVLCLAVPARAAAELLASVEAAAAITARLSALPTTDDVLLVTLLVEDATLTRAGAPLGSGVLLPDDEQASPVTPSLRAKALTHASAKWGWLAAQLPDDHHVVRLSFGGTHDVMGDLDPNGAVPPDTAQYLVAAAHGELRRLLGAALDDPHGAARDAARDGAHTNAAGASQVRASLVTRWQGALSRPVVGRAAALVDIDAQLRTVPGLALVGSAVAGNGLAGVVARSHREAGRTL